MYLKLKYEPERYNDFEKRIQHNNGRKFFDLIHDKVIDIAEKNLRKIPTFLIFSSEELENIFGTDYEKNILKKYETLEKQYLFIKDWIKKANYFTPENGQFTESYIQYSFETLSFHIYFNKDLMKYLLFLGTQEIWDLPTDPETIAKIRAILKDLR